MYQTFKKTLITLVLTLTLFANFSGVAYAQDCDIGDEPTPVQIVCPLQKTLVVIYYSSGAFFLIMVFVTSYKFSTSQGDPKAMQAAKQSLTYTVLGFVLTITTFAITFFIGRQFDSPSLADPNSPFTSLTTGICNILQFANISAPGC